MIDHKTMDDLTHKILDILPDSVQTLKFDLEKNIRAALESTLSQMNLVSREEFDIQSALLSRTREKLNQLEAQIKDLQK